MILILVNTLFITIIKHSKQVLLSLMPVSYTHLAAIVAEKTTAKEQIETEIAALSDNISVLKEQLKSKKSALRLQ